MRVTMESICRYIIHVCAQRLKFLMRQNKELRAFEYFPCHLEDVIEGICDRLRGKEVVVSGQAHKSVSGTIERELVRAWNEATSWKITPELFADILSATGKMVVYELQQEYQGHLG